MSSSSTTTTTAMPKQQIRNLSRMFATSIPKSNNDRDNQAIKSIKSAIKSPKTKSFPLLECEFPALSSLNKLGDGSLRSTKQAEEANLLFAKKLLNSLSSPIPFMGGGYKKTWLLTSMAASNSFLKAAVAIKTSATSVHSLKDGLPLVEKGDVCVLVTPSTKGDYDYAKRLAEGGIVAAVIIVNGFAKDAKSIPSTATMAYFLKPLTYNSQIAGYLLRSYPEKWTTVDSSSQDILDSSDDGDILVRGTNTPDLRRSVKLVQKSVDQRAIQARRATGF